MQPAFWEKKKKKEGVSPTSLCDGIILDNLQNVVSRIKICE